MSFKISLKYGKETKEISLPENNLMGVLRPADFPKAANGMGEVRRALSEPIGSKPLSELAKGKENVVILVSDITRPVPSCEMLPPLMEELDRAGVKDEQITIIFGLGNHRPHSREEQEELVGKEIFARLKCLDHNPHDCISLGETSRGTPVEVFRPAAEADFIIATGNIELHYCAGYTAGNKALMPGICSKRSIEMNHRFMMESGTAPGKLVGNPMREDIEEAGAKAGVGFILNVVLSPENKIIRAVAGHRIRAHREGAELVDKIYRRPIPHRADIVIASPGGSPKDSSLYQVQKGLENAGRAVRKGGIIILAAECGEQYGEPLFQEWITRARSIDEPIQWIKEGFQLGAHKAAALCRVLMEKTAFLVSEMPRHMVEDCFFSYGHSVEEALEKSFAQLGGDAKILVMPNANTTMPLIESKN